MGVAIVGAIGCARQKRSSADPTVEPSPGTPAGVRMSLLRTDQPSRRIRPHPQMPAPLALNRRSRGYRRSRSDSRSHESRRSTCHTRERFYRLLALALAAGLVAAPGLAWDLSGAVVFTDEGGQAVASGPEASSTVVVFRPRGGAAPAAPGQFDVAMRKKVFEPKVLLVPRGARVRFPNEDPILHNVFSVSQGNTFDLGLYRQGEGDPVRLDSPGLVRVFCNVHHDMVAYVWVLDTPHATQPDPTGRFTLRGLPGAGELEAWHERAESVTLAVSGDAQPLEIRLVLDKPRIPPHFDKTGRRYATERRRY